MPGVFGGLVSVLAIAVSGSKGFPANYWPAVGEGEGVGSQAVA